MAAIEHETIINFNAEEKEAEIYSCQKYIWSRCEKLGLEPKNIGKNQEGEIISKTYMCPKKWIKIRKPREYSPEQKEKLQERGRALYAKSKISRSNQE